ncbi:MAG: FixH family protein [Chloroflexota bacterium]|nr:FixH family protein [Chloroflexota bacterium]
MRPLITVAAATVFALAGCAGATPTPAPSVGAYPGWPPRTAPETFELVPIPVSTELAVGQNRFLLNLIDRQNEPLASPEREVTLNFYDLATDPAQPQVSVAGTYLPTTPQLPGLYRAQVEFGSAGEWGLEVVTAEPDGSRRTGRVVFPVRPSSSTPAVGADAPASQTPTATTPAQIAQISTDRPPDPDFYRTSVDQALADGRPFLLVFATPAFCQTATCGPALDIVKTAAADYKDEVEFIHVEPYRLEMVDGHLQPELDENNRPIPVEAVTEWGLTTEPYIFVVDSAGKVGAKLEGVASVEEIQAALADVAE